MSAATWSGFSEEDQARIKSATERRSNGIGQETRKSEATNEVANKKPEPKESRIQKHSNGLTLGDGSKNGDLPPEALFSPKHVRQEKGSESPAHVKLKIAEDSTSFEIMETIPLDSPRHETANRVSPTAIPPRTPSPVNVPADVVNGEKKEINLDEFEKKRKLIEEQNRLKKQMLAKTLAMRKMKTQAEAQKLQQIQEELSKLDANLSNDVGILRGHIEIASVELADAEKRYAKAEREFIEAKQLLFSKRERKDLLTEHLCTIIEQNEMRKAHRLTDLMVQLSDQDQMADAALNQIIDPVGETDNNV